jgi:Fur family peroxide stress response transcriptional regulator
VKREDLERFAAHCREHGLSVTHQRLAIFEALASSREHPSAEQLHRSVQRKLPTLSLATVYKNLEALKAIGAVSDVNALHDEGRYEASLPGTGAGSGHHHLVCTSCRKVRDLHDPALDGLQLHDSQGFSVRAVRVQAEGLCPECMAKERAAAARRKAPAAPRKHSV